MSNLALRTLTALVGCAVALGAAWAGGWVFAALVVGVALAAQRETYALFAASGARPFAALGLAMGAVAVVRPLVPAAEPVLVLGVLVVLGGVLWRRSDAPLADAAATLFGVVYPAALCASLVALRLNGGAWLGAGDTAAGDAAAFWLTTAALVCVWGADSFAYFTGRAFGRRLLFPRASPKKTWEGAVGGAVGALGLAAAFGAFSPIADVMTWTDVAALGLACGVAAPCGDLAQSVFKRAAGVKDSGTLVPGHGGVLDRIDAALVAVPLVALYAEWLRP